MNGWRKAAIACWVIQGMVLVGLLRSGEPVIPEDVARLGIVFQILFVCILLLFLIIGAIFYKKSLTMDAHRKVHSQKEIGQSGVQEAAAPVEAERTEGAKAVQDPPAQPAKFGRKKYDTYYTCPNCGSLVKKGTYTCDCGYVFRKKRNWKKTGKWLMLSAAVLLVFVGGVYFSYQYGYQTAEEKTGYVYKQKLINAEAKANRLEDELEHLEQEWEEAENELDFWDDHAVIVTSSEGEKYHRYSCYHWKGSSFYIYNIELAEYMGYEPCEDCFKSYSFS